MMRKIVTAAVAALTLGGAAAATATPASAQSWRGGGYDHGYRGGWGHGGWGRGGWGPGAAVGAGILGLAVGAAIADHPRAYATPAYGYGYGYAPCGGLRWDPYLGRYVRADDCY
jgi:hypothetical protein